MALQAGLAALLLFGLAAPVLREGVRGALISLDLRAPPKPPPPPPRHVARARRAAPAAPPAPHAAAAPFVAPPVPALTPPPIFAAAAPGAGRSPAAGAAAAGTGTGAGGSGTGAGAGGTGDGDGSGPEKTGGRIKVSDTPQEVREAPLSVSTRSLVSIDARGRVSDCRPLGSSGNADLDALTCRLIRQRFRFRPARDAGGQAVAGRVIYEHDWEVGGRFDSDPPG